MLINKEVRVETINVCNTHCVICPRSKMTRPKCVMPLSHFRKIADQAKELGAEVLSPFGYGEPLMDKTIHLKIEYCTQIGLDTFITTNGSLLNRDKCERLIDAGLGHVRISVHGFGKDYNEIHGLDFDFTMRNIERFMGMRGDCKLSISVIPMHGETVEDIVAFWGSRVDFLEIWKPHNWTDGKHYRNIERKKKTCGRPFNGPVQINADGNMMVCCFDYNATLTVGDTYKQTIGEILRGDAFNRIRSAHESGDLSGLICERCDQLNVEDENPLLYSSRDSSCELGKTSSTKFKLKEI